MNTEKTVEILPIVGKTIKAITGMTEGSDEILLQFGECDSYFIGHLERGCCETIDILQIFGDNEACKGLFI